MLLPSIALVAVALTLIQDSAPVDRVAPMATHAGATSRSTAVEWSFTGRVENAIGAGVAGALVLSDHGGRAETDWQGHFELRLELPSDLAELRLSALHTSTRTESATRVLPLAPGGGAQALAPLVLSADALCTATWLPTFGGTVGMEGDVDSIAVFDSGSGPELYVAGNFRHIHGIRARNIARFDGSEWKRVGSGLSKELVAIVVGALIVFDDGSGPALYAGGNFDTAGSVAANGLAKWDGTDWSTVGPTSSSSDYLFDLEVFDDGSGPALYGAGVMHDASGVQIPGAARLGVSGWQALGSGLDFALPTDLLVHDDGSGSALYWFGSVFRTTAAPTDTYRGVVRWNGSAWSSIVPVGTATSDGIVNAAEVYDDGTGPALYVGGTFTQFAGVAASFLARWDGASWSEVGGGLAGAAVLDLESFDDGSGAKLFVAGNLNLAGGSLAVRHAAAWDGSQWSAADGGANGICRELGGFDLGTGPELFLGGQFNLAGTTGTSRVARLVGGQWTNFGAGVDGPVRALATFDDGTGLALYAGGDFLDPGEAGASRVARWDGTGWSALGEGFDDTVESLAVLELAGREYLCAGGQFTHSGSQSIDHVAIWNGSAWSQIAGGLDDTVEALLVHDDGSGPALYAAGSFTATAGGAPVRHVAKWSGGAWSALAGGLASGQPNALASYDDGGGAKLYVGGWGLSVDGNVHGGLVRWDGASFFEYGAQLFGKVESLAVYPLGGTPMLIAGGHFSTLDGDPADRIVAHDGVGWQSIGEGFDLPVTHVAVHDLGCGPRLYASGYFRRSGSTPLRRIAQWDGARWLALGGGIESFALDSVSFDDGSGPAVFFGGFFEHVPGARDGYLAKWGLGARAGEVTR